MSDRVAAILSGEFGLDSKAQELLTRNIKSLGREERRYYFQHIKPLEKSFKKYLSQHCVEEEREATIRETVSSMLDKKGDPDLADSIVMDVVGRLTVYKLLRERAENDGIKLSAMTNFGGLSMVLFAVVIITAIVLYLKSM
ncbi:MAG: hypothetical protein ACOY31_01280 [Bacillota bacterium]